jgi:hypothetical protein
MYVCMYVEGYNYNQHSSLKNKIYLNWPLKNNVCCGVCCESTYLTYIGVCQLRYFIRGYICSFCHELWIKQLAKQKTKRINGKFFPKIACEKSSSCHRSSKNLKKSCRNYSGMHT